jgi:hypothetical protein
VIPWRFLFFCLTMAGMVYLHFYFSHRQWRRLRGEESSDVDPSYVKREDYFAQSFRSKLRGWLDLPSAASPLESPRTVVRDRETICVSPPLRLNARATSDDVLVVEGDFACGEHCTLSREIYTRGSAEIGARSHIQAIAADQDLTLGDGVTVARWVDSSGELRIGRSCVIHSRVTAQKAIHLAMDAEMQSVFAPEISSDPDDSSDQQDHSPFTVLALQIPLPDPASAEGWKKIGFDHARLSRLDSDSWIYEGTLRPGVPLRLTVKLVVKGDFACVPGSLIERDLKATGRLAIGDGSQCRGNLIAGKSLYLGPQVRFSGILHSGAAVWLSRGVRGEARESPVAAHAASSLYVEAGVTIHGKLSAGKHVKVVSASFSEKWRHRYEFSREQV